MAMVSSEERLARMEALMEQSIDRVSKVEDTTTLMLDKKADKNDVRLLFIVMVALFSAVIGLLGVILSKL